jgi:uncharacterized protein|tara:strand:+ start:1342 stop:1830 length:489 start_codon:yes stop_codon:yes gene_type:complete
MEILFLVLSIVFILLGIAGSFLPVLPGPLTSWGGLLLLHYHSKVEQNPSFLWITFGIALAVFLLDYIIPAIGTKKFGGTKSGVYGASIGLIIGLLFLGPFGVLAGPFFGAYVGELLHDNNQKKALKSALGSLIGFLGGVFIKFSVAIIYLYFFCAIVWKQLL